MDLFDLYAKISLDTSEYENGLDDASKKTSTFAGTIKNGLATAAKVGTAALAAAAAGVAALTKSSIDQYAEYEQLVGGVETLFKESSDIIQDYAANAYKTAGVSANTYMEQATAFSASLIQSLGGDTQAAAEYANQAIMDMSDNANKMGTDIESIQATYQSLMRGNYAMLDNLKLGYGGTKAELERLVEDAEELTGKALDPSKFSDVITAIHAVQENLGITGTTAEEAATTIEGSVGMMKAAWSNLLAGIADENADLGTLINNFASSVGTAAENIIPRITQILSGLGSAISQIAPIIAQQLPGVISSVLPSMISAGVQLLVGLATGLISAIPQLISSIPQIVTEVYNSLVESGPQLIQAGGELLTMLGNGILEGIPALIENLPDVITAIFNFLAENAPKFIESGLEFIGQLALGIINAIPGMVAKLPEVISAISNFIASNLPVILEKGAEILGELALGIIQAIPELVASLPLIIQAIVDGIASLMGSILEVGKDIVRGIWDGIQEMASWITEKVTGFFSGIVDSVKGLLGIHSPSTVFSEMGKNMALGLGEGWDNEYDRIRRNIEGGLDFGTANVDFASSGLGVASAGMVNGISSAFQDTSGGTITVNLMMPDGTKYASYLLGPLSNYAKANGTPILNPT